MAIDFTVKDIMHKVIAKFTPNHLPEAKKAYNLKAKFQPELDVHGLASKADVYNIETDPRVIEEGFNAACALTYYLTADGYTVKTPLFNSRMRLPGEYEGNETSLTDGANPEIRFQAAAAFRKYIAANVKVDFDGIDDADGFIADALDEKTGQIDEVVTIGNILAIHGYGLKIEADPDHTAVADHMPQCGVFFVPPAGIPIKAELVPVNEPKTLKVIAPATLAAGTSYTLRIFTMSSAKHGSGLLKNVRDMKSDFTLTAQT